MSKDYDTYEYEATSFDSPMETEFAFWEQSDDPFAPCPIRQLPQTHTYWQSQGAKKQCSYDLHEDFIHHAHRERSGFDDGGVSDIPSSPLSTLSCSTSSSRTSDSPVPSALFSGTEIQRRPSEAGSHHSTGSAHVYSSPVTPPPGQPKRQNVFSGLEKKYFMAIVEDQVQY
ncbi:hypothetical protein D9619_006482 [Psilocybe cf. subviscida]|uniref:Uncharacterized protein n=1 Tax=Psilocybe cf. subviscida TaxID=2480587 RepID=A0A8H5B517_9AGAR|nr:hypothetical protein D9619_006482 [Psilocybe cf. subviscida]